MKVKVIKINKNIFKNNKNISWINNKKPYYMMIAIESISLKLYEAKHKTITLKHIYYFTEEAPQKGDISF